MRVCGGQASTSSTTRPSASMRQRGARILGRGADVAYDHLIVTPGIDFSLEEIESYDRDGLGASASCLEGRTSDPCATPSNRTDARRRCRGPEHSACTVSVPPGPYERACIITAFLKRTKPRSKLLVLDANPDVTSKAGLFKAAWKDLYAGFIDYRPNARAMGSTRTR